MFQAVFPTVTWFGPPKSCCWILINARLFAAQDELQIWLFACGSHSIDFSSLKNCETILSRKGRNKAVFFQLLHENLHIFPDLFYSGIRV